MIRFQIQLGWPATAELEESQHESDSCGDAEHYRGWCYSSILQADRNTKGLTDKSLGIQGFSRNILTAFSLFWMCPRSWLFPSQSLDSV